MWERQKDTCMYVVWREKTHKNTQSKNKHTLHTYASTSKENIHALMMIIDSVATSGEKY